jgi:hypothetical protein
MNGIDTHINHMTYPISVVDFTSAGSKSHLAWYDTSAQDGTGAL